MSPTRTSASTSHMLGHIAIKSEPSDSDADNRRSQEFDEKPTDLSMDGPTDLSSNSTRHVNIICSPDPPTLRDSSVSIFREEDK